MFLSNFLKLKTLGKVFGVAEGDKNIVGGICIKLFIIHLVKNFYLLLPDYKFIFFRQKNLIKLNSNESIIEWWRG